MHPVMDGAAGVMRIATQRMVRSYPFHAHLLSAGRTVEDATIDTMAVTIRGNELLFLYNRDFVLAHDLEEIVGVLHHEVLHVVLGHLLAPPERYPNRRARTIAEEVTVNEWVPERLPDGAILLRDFPQLPSEEDTETRYKRLVKDKQGPDGMPQPTDDHAVWAEAVAAGRVGEAIVASAVGRAVEALSDAELAALPGELKEAINGLLHGAAAMRTTETLGRRADGGKVPWQQILRRYVARATSVRPTYLRPARRFPELVGIVPGTTRHADKPRLVSVIDTSGSMTTNLLEQIGAELRNMSATYTVTVVECDAAIHRIYRFQRDLDTVQGRGGTDLRPPLEREVLAELRPDVVVYFTDGYGPAPDRAPRVPVIWCLPPHGEPPAAWGRRVWMT